MENVESTLSEKDIKKIAEEVNLLVRADRESERREFKKRAIHNTRLLMSNYKKLKAHIGTVEDQLLADQDTFWNHRWLDLNSLMQNKAKTVKLMKHVDICLEVYKRECEESSSTEESRRYTIVERKYLWDKKQSDEQIADYFNKDRSTINRNCKEAIKDLSLIIFGVDMLNYW